MAIDLDDNVKDLEKASYRLDPADPKKTCVAVVAKATDGNGTTDHENGTVGTGVINIPSVAGGKILSLVIDNINVTNSKKLLVSFDGGTLFKTIEAGDVFQLRPFSQPTQIKLKGAEAGVKYEIVLNREDP